MTESLALNRAASPCATFFSLGGRVWVFACFVGPPGFGKAGRGAGFAAGVTGRGEGITNDELRTDVTRRRIGRKSGAGVPPARRGVACDARARRTDLPNTRRAVAGRNVVAGFASEAPTTEWRGRPTRIRCLSAPSGNKPAAFCCRAVHGQDCRATPEAGETPAPLLMPALPGADAPELPPPPLLLSAKWIPEASEDYAGSPDAPLPSFGRNRVVSAP